MNMGFLLYLRVSTILFVTPPHSFCPVLALGFCPLFLVCSGKLPNLWQPSRSTLMHLSSPFTPCLLPSRVSVILFISGTCPTRMSAPKSQETHIAWYILSPAAAEVRLVCNSAKLVPCHHWGQQQDQEILRNT